MTYFEVTTVLLPGNELEMRVCLGLPGNLPEVTCRTKYLVKAPLEPEEKEEGLKQKLTMLTKYVKLKRNRKKKEARKKKQKKTHCRIVN